MRGVTRVDAAVALGFVVAALAESMGRDQGTPARLVFDATGALWLALLAVRRSRPLVPMMAISAMGLLGVVLTPLWWPDADDGGGVWIVALMLAAYSVGAYCSGRAVVLGVVLPVVVVLVADGSTRSGWDRINGVLFVSLFVGLLPTAVGRMVRIRQDRLVTLHEQGERIVEGQRFQQASAVRAEWLRANERLQPTLLHGLQALAASAESGAEPGEIETSARDLLARTREEVLSLTAPVASTEVEVDVPAADHVRALRESAQSWTVLAAGAVVVGLFAETTRVLAPAVPAWAVLPASVLVGAPLLLSWWRPVSAVTVAWIAAAAYSRLVAPLDGTLTETAFALASAFAVGALSRRRTAVIGLVVCLLGQVAGVAAGDPVGATALLLLSWLGGVAVNEASRLVEQNRANLALLERQDAARAASAVIDERLRIAREVHDVIGHSLTVVALQAGAARRLASTDPDRARAAVRDLAGAAREGVASLLSDDLDRDLDLNRLVTRVRAAGLEIDADLTAAELLEPAQRTAAFHVLREGLTNVLRHAPGSHAVVASRRCEDDVEIVITNSAPATAGTGPGTGRGLLGLRERVSAAAGKISWKAREGGGFEVCAVLPASAVTVAAP